ncbi:Autophagy protein 7 [Chamberlinius hualienensis]
MGEAIDLQFSPFSSAVDMGFWWTLSKKKLEDFQLLEEPVEINGYYSIGDPPRSSGRLNVDYTAFEEKLTHSVNTIPCKGTLLVVNTIEMFKKCDKKELLNGEGCKIWEMVESGSALVNPSELNRFLLVTYVDLKKYTFYYWFAFPALCHQPCKLLSQPQYLCEYFTQNQLEEFSRCQEEFFKSNADHSHFLVHIVDDSVKLFKLTDYETILSKSGKIVFGICDPCTLEKHPGWPLRNYLTLILNRIKKEGPLEILCFRQRFKEGVREINHSIILKIEVPSKLEKDMPGVVGWEKNERGNMGPRMINCSANMDPSKLLESSVDLNLKLMKWRLVPDLKLDNIQNCRCLLLDCTEGGKPKATAAAEAMKKIFPQINAVGVQMSIPMPGHHVSDNCVEEIKKDVHRLEELIDNHDAIFLLMDTRESRWLPTVIAAATTKLVINAALGFDSFLVMRHGLPDDTDKELESPSSSDAKESKLLGTQLGCYFCNDVVAPGDSTMNRTMDQQCTVARPGISMIAAGMAVELLVSILQHDEGGFAPAEPSCSDYSHDAETVLGIVPHHIRGFLSRFSNILPVCRRYSKCPACSPVIISEYKTRGFDFLISAFNQPSYLEDLTGLTKLYQETDEAEVWEFSE